jgi:hypothetical protein
VEEGLGGDGLEAATVKEARSLAAGDMPTEAKIRKAYRWWARNERFLSADEDTPADVAANLWGGRPGMTWFRDLYDELDTSDSEQSSKGDMDRMSARFKASGSITDNQIEAVASTTGNMDRTGDVIAPGAFKSSVLRDFVQNGALLAFHEWDDEPIGMPVSAAMRGNELVSVGQFHTTQKGQDFRKIAMERIEAGLSVSVSVGFMPDYDSMSFYPSGKALMDACEEMGMDTAAFDTKSITAWKSGCRLIRSVTELFEWSIVLVGANPKAKTRTVKDFTGESAHGLTLEQELEISLAGIERALDVAELRSEDGRRLNDSRLRIIRDINELSGKILSLSAPVDDAEIQRRAAVMDRVAKALASIK